MPVKKSVLSLRDTCLQFVSEHIDSLQQEAQKLPDTMIQELYELCCDNENLRLPSKLFITPATTSIKADIIRFDLPMPMTLDKISEECKNLEELKLRSHKQKEKIAPEILSKLLISISRIVYLNLCEVRECTDHHLSLIAEHCPHLQYLNLDNCSRVTDDGIKFLSRNTEINYLSLIETRVTAKGCLFALKNLNKLKHLFQHYWYDILKSLSAELHSGSKPTTYSIVNLQILWNTFEFPVFNFGETVSTCFPKLKQFYCDCNEYFNPNIVSVIQKFNENLVNICLMWPPIDIIRIIGYFCPMLESLTLLFDEGNEGWHTTYKYFETPDDRVPYKHLQYLSIKLRRTFLSREYLRLSREYLRMLFQNCHQLESLTYEVFHGLSVDISFIIGLGNQFRHLEDIDFGRCEPRSVNAILKLLEFLPAIRFVRIGREKKYVSKFAVLEEHARHMNWDVCLDLYEPKEPKDSPELNIDMMTLLLNL